MKKISSGLTFFYKRVFPIAWLGFIVIYEFVVLGCLFMNKMPMEKGIIFMVLPLLMFIAGLCFFSKLFWNLMDEVYYDEMSLLIKNGNESICIPFCEIKEINYKNSRPPRIEVILNKKTVMGNALYFVPPVRIIAFSKHPDIEAFFEKLRNSNVTTV